MPAKELPNGWIEAWTTVQRLLVIGLDAPDVVRSALVQLREWLPTVDVTLLGCTSAWRQTTVPIAVPIHTYSNPKMQASELHQMVQWMREGRFDAAIVFTAANRSPYALAYLCYLAGIPIRIGQSSEFGGQVLSHCFSPPDPMQGSDRHLDLIHSFTRADLCDDCES